MKEESYLITGNQNTMFDSIEDMPAPKQHSNNVTIFYQPEPEPQMDL